MPKVLAPEDIDPIADEVDLAMQETGEAEQSNLHRFDPNGSFPDLSDGGVVNGVRVRPMPASGRVTFGKEQEPGRPVARQLWMWNGRPTLVPLSWDTDGKHHDGGRRYLQKRHCTVCNYSGFYGAVCPACRKAGRPVGRDMVVAAFYLREDQTPQHLHAYGSVSCFVEGCVRKGQYGFRNRTEMRQHAMKKHRDEYRAFMDEQGSAEREEVAALRREIAEMREAAQRPASVPVAAPVAVPVTTPPTVSVTVPDAAPAGHIIFCGCGGWYTSPRWALRHARTQRHTAWAAKQAA